MYNRKHFHDFKKGSQKQKSPINRIPANTKVIIDDVVNDL